MTQGINLSLLISYCALIFWLSNQTSLQPPMTFQYQDKVLHIGAYFIMGALAWRSFFTLCKTRTKTAILSFFFCALYGLSDEWHQSFVPGRYYDLLDWYADMIGAIIAVLVFCNIPSRTISA